MLPRDRLRLSFFLHGLMVLSIGSLVPAVAADPVSATRPSLFARDNLVAWCIVPFDGEKRGPEQRAAMLQRLGIKQLAYDYRAEHIPTFDAELDALARHGIRLTAWWFPPVLNNEALGILGVLQRHGMKTQLWVTGGGRRLKVNRKGGGGSRRRPAVSDRSPRRPRPLAARWPSTTMAAGLVSRKTR